MAVLCDVCSIKITKFYLEPLVYKQLHTLPLHQFIIKVYIFLKENVRQPGQSCLAERQITGYFLMNGSQHRGPTC
jgi:hypothetical protein